MYVNHLFIYTEKRSMDKLVYASHVPHNDVMSARALDVLSLTALGLGSRDIASKVNLKKG